MSAERAARPQSRRSGEHVRTVARLTPLFEVSQSIRPLLLLGAGASFRSGVPLAADATRRIAREAYARQRLGTSTVAEVKPSDYMRFLAEQAWFIKGTERFAENFPLAVKQLLTPRAYRRDFFARELRAHNDLSEGYVALARLAQRGLWRTILTTNFDPCTMEALARLSPHVRRPIEVDLHEVRANTFDIYGLHPHVVYLHGRVETYTDRNTPDEVAALDPQLATLLSLVLSSSPLIVIGYRGAEPSIMDGLFDAVRSSTGNFRAGIYWCRMSGEALHPRVQELKAASGSNFIELPIDGFDELLVDLNTRLASQDMYARLSLDASSREASSAPDEQILPNVTMADLDDDVLLSTLATYCSKVERPPVTRETASGLLLEQGLVRAVDRELRPTVGGFLLFGRDVQARFPHAYIELTFGGKRRQIIRGNLISQYKELLGILSAPEVNREIRLKTEKSSRKIRAYHSRGITEMLVNLLVHRDYSLEDPSRIDVRDGEGVRFTNPGGLPEPIAHQLLHDGDGVFAPVRAVTHLRNAALADVFYGLGPMDKSGSGLCDAIELMREHGGEARFAVAEQNSRFVAELLQARQASPGASETAIALHPYGIYITNHLRVAVMPQSVTVLGLAPGARFSGIRGADLFGDASGDAPVFIQQKDRIVSFNAPARLTGTSRDSTRTDTEYFRTQPGGYGTLSHLLRAHFVRFLRRFAADGLHVDHTGHRAYFIKRSEDTPRIRYDTPRRQGIEREMVKRREMRNEVFHENEGIAFDVVRFDGVWAFEIKPFYMFTGPDGASPLPPHRRTRLSTSRMRFDRNPAVRSDLGFWSRYLSQGAPVIRLADDQDYDLVIEGAFHEIEVLETERGATEGVTDGG